MTGELALRWRASDPARVEAWLRDVGLTPAGEGRLGCRGLSIVVERGAGERLAVVEENDGPDDQPGPERADAVDAPRLLAVGLATVDLERAAGTLGGIVELLPDDELLGARAARVGDPRLVLLEPTREGRLAATLARVGESPAVLYLGLTAAPLDAALRRLRADGAVVAAGDGPLGRQRLVRADPAWAPHLVLVEDPAIT